MFSVPSQLLAAERARWLAELSDLLGEARELVSDLELAGVERATAFELFLRIEAARLEVQSLRLSRTLNPRTQSNPEWTESGPWRRAEGDGS